MKTHTSVEQRSQHNSGAQAQAPLLVDPQPSYEDARPETAQLKLLREMMSASSQQQKLQAVQAKIANGSPQLHLSGTPELDKSTVTKSNNHAGAVIQLEKSRYKASSSDDKEAIDSYFDTFNAAVQKAFYYALFKPGLGEFASVQNGHLEHWREVWNSYLFGGQPQLPAAAFGYVVETLTELLYLPAPPSGMKVAPQQTRGGTRPDYILTKEGNDIAWIDITASNSAGHIEDKAGWNAIDSFVEVTYPSVNLADIKSASKSKEAETFNPDLDIGAAAERIKYAQKLRQFRKSWWRDLGTALFPHPIAGSNELTRDQERRAEAIARLNDQYSLSLSVDNQDHLRLAGSIIFIMGKSPVSWGFLLSVSSAQGEAFLMDYDLNLKNVDAIFDQRLKEGSL